MSIPTPSLSHLTAADFRYVYEPAEDTFILLDALEQDQEALRGQTAFRSYSDAQPQSSRNQAQRPRLCVELGSGSGCVSTFIGKIIGSSSTAILSIDINPRAVDCTKRTGQANTVHLEPILANMLASVRTRTRTTKTDGSQKQNAGVGTIDLLVFNPPYVPTPEEEEANAQRTCDISGAWAGGLTGTRLVDELIDGLNSTPDSQKTGIEYYLSPGAAFYLVAIRQNDPPALVKRLQARGLDAEIVMQRRAGREHLFVIRALNINASHTS